MRAAPGRPRGNTPQRPSVPHSDPRGAATACTQEACSACDAPPSRQAVHSFLARRTRRDLPTCRSDAQQHGRAGRRLSCSIHGSGPRARPSSLQLVQNRRTGQAVIARHSAPAFPARDARNCRGARAAHARRPAAACWQPARGITAEAPSATNLRSCTASQRPATCCRLCTEAAATGAREPTKSSRVAATPAPRVSRESRATAPRPRVQQLGRVG